MYTYYRNNKYICPRHVNLQRAYKSIYCLPVSLVTPYKWLRRLKHNFKMEKSLQKSEFKHQ